MKTVSSSTLALAIALALTACGGGSGGGNVKSTPPPAAPPVIPPPAAGPVTPAAPPSLTPPPPGTAPEFCTTPGSVNYGGWAPCVAASGIYRGTQDNLLIGTSAYVARAMGFDGKGVKVGLLDDERLPYATIDSKVAYYKDYTGAAADSADNAKRGHGALMGALIAGDPSGGYAGGIAPGTSLYWGRICSMDYCRTDWAASALQDMIGRGVRLFNASLSGNAQDPNPAQYAPAYASGYGQALLQGDALLVASTGNVSSPNPGYPALLPAYDPQYSRNIIAAANLSLDAAGQPAGLSSTSNQCGIAAQWCIAAPGTNTQPPLAGTQWQSGSTGTSNAAAIITGTAALVWQAFPWMSAYNVQQTVLTTATDIGAPGVDSVYGWGLVNAGRAVKGPGRFVTDFDANVSGMAWFLNDISGTGGLIKRGAGQLMLTGASTYSGKTVVEQGVLGVSGSLSTSVLVKSGATFQSYGAHVGAYTAEQNATTAVQIGKGLNVAGAAALNGTLQLLAEPNGYTVKATEQIIGAGAISGTFSTITYGSGLYYTAALSYGPTSVNAALTRTSTASAASAANLSAVAVDVGTRLDTAFGGAQAPALGGFNRLVSIANTASAGAELESLSGEVQGTARTIGIQDAVQHADRVAERLATLPRDTDGGMWLQAMGADSALRQGAFADASIQSQGWMAGVDRRLSGNMLVGVSLSKSHAEGTLEGLAGSVDANRTGLAVFARLPAGKAYVSAVLGHDQVDTSTRRAAVLGGDIEAVTGDRKDRVLHGRVEAGVSFGKATPFLAIGAVRHTQGAFAEVGGAGLGLMATADAHVVSIADLGVRFEHAFDRCTFGGSLALRRVLSGEDGGYIASFTGAPGTGFRIAGQPLSLNSQRADLHGRCLLTDSLSLYGGAGVELSQGNRRHVQGVIGIRVGF